MRLDRALAALGSSAEPAAAGVACALAGAAAASLVELTAELAATRLAADRPRDPDSVTEIRSLATRACALRGRLLAAADDDVAAYTRVAEAPDADARAAALEAASAPPLAIAECAAELAGSAARIGAAGDWAFSPDAVVAGELALAVARGACELVAVNLTGHPGDPRLVRARAAAERAGNPVRNATD
jgi:formiminotetrahydrofolate cyclodeaminase